jgi:hypothetical protein
MKTSIALIVAETRRTVGRLARGAAAQARRVLALLWQIMPTPYLVTQRPSQSAEIAGEAPT